MKNTKVKQFIRVLLFNIIETLTIFMIGLTLKISYNYIIALMIIFFLIRAILGQPKHYKKAYLCFIWSTLTFTSVYLTTDLPLTVNILMTIFTGFIVTGKADINDLYMWKGTNSKYIALIDIVAFSPNNPTILEHEEYWRKNYPMRFEIFRLYFRERKTYEDIMELKDLPDSKLIQRECRSIYDILERPLNLPPIQ
jgi:hypothetical protein